MQRSVRPLALVLALLVAACGPGGLSPSDDGTAHESDALNYGPGSSTLEGIDVANCQGGSIDWQRVKDSGRVFAIARAAHVPDSGTADSSAHCGASWNGDASFARNWSEMKRVGLIRGAYQYFVNTQDAAQQAQLFLQLVPSLGEGDLPPVLDVEDPNAPTSASAIMTWVNTVQNALGRKPIVYTGAYYWSGWTSLENQNPGFTTDHLLWLPNYCNHPSDLTTCEDQSIPLPAPWTKWAMHQYADNGNVPGIGGNVDLDVFDGTYQDLEALAARTTCTATCDGKLAVHSDCTRTDCGAEAGHCVSDSSGPRCIADACPASGTKDVCLSTAKTGHCVNGVVQSSAACASGDYCSAAGGAARCVSSFCAPDASTAPSAHVACYSNPQQIAHCDANGGLTLESCPDGEHCEKEGASFGCAPPVCPTSGTKMACADATTFGRCADGAFTKLTDCADLGDLCVDIGGAHCASASCVNAGDTSTSAHDVCLGDGQLGHCDATGLLVGTDPCPSDSTCHEGACETKTPTTTPPTTKQGCGCDGASTGLGALALVGLFTRRRKVTR